MSPLKKPPSELMSKPLLMSLILLPLPVMAEIHPCEYKLIMSLPEPFDTPCRHKGEVYKSFEDYCDSTRDEEAQPKDGIFVYGCRYACN